MNKLTLIALFGLVCIASAALDANCKTAADDNGSPSTTECAECNDGYALSQDALTCTACDADSNCSKCPAGTTTCTACKTGYGLKGSTCEKCDLENCINCDSDETKCKTCADGYANTRSDDEEVDGSCVPCENGCKTCGTIDASCSSCPTGQEKNATDNKNVFCCAVNCSTCSTTQACLTCKDGSSLNDKNACVFGFKTSATLTLGAVVSIAILSLLF